MVTSWRGADNLLVRPLAVIIGAPAYINNHAVIPMVTHLLDNGTGAGPAMALMLAGGVTSIPAAIAVFALVRQPVLSFTW